MSRYHVNIAARSGEMIWREASRLLDTVDPKPVRLVGCGIYNLSGEIGRQLSVEDILEEAPALREAERKRLLDGLADRYHLDFAGHLEEIYRGDVLHRTVEYMRKHFPR